MLFPFVIDTTEYFLLFFVDTYCNPINSVYNILIVNKKLTENDMFSIVEVIRKRGQNLDKSYVVVDNLTKQSVETFNHKYQAEMFITRQTDYRAIGEK